MEMPDRLTQRAMAKRESRNRILEAAAGRLRNDGIEGTSIIPVMKDAGLTHGTFNSHFADKNELVVAAFVHAIGENRERWVGPIREQSWPKRVVHLARGYLNREHRDHRLDSCPFSAVATDAARSTDEFRRVFKQELKKSLNAMGGRTIDDSEEHPHYDEAIALMALFVGGLSLARAVDDKGFSDRILKACQTAAERMTPLKD